MGTFSAKRLQKGLAEYSITRCTSIRIINYVGYLTTLIEFHYVFSSMKDSRFKPIRPDEIPRLLCAVSLLTNFEKGDHFLDWEVSQTIV